MKEYFIVANSFAAPFCSDTSEKYVEAGSPQEALEQFAKKYDHPFGLYFAACFASADDYHKDKKALATWKCNLVLAQEELTKDKKGGYSVKHDPFGTLEIDGVRTAVKDPKGGKVR